MTTHPVLRIAVLAANQPENKTEFGRQLTGFMRQLAQTLAAAGRPAEVTGASSLLSALRLSTPAPDRPLWPHASEVPLTSIAHVEPILDSAPLQQALAVHPTFDHHFMLGLPASSSPLDLTTIRLDAQCRQALMQAGIPFQVLHGSTDDWLRQALSMVLPNAESTPTTLEFAGNTEVFEGQRQDLEKGAAGAPRATPKPWIWACDKCSDSACEHRLLSDLLSNRNQSLNPEP